MDRFIAFEGGEGTGKSTQARLLADRLGRAGLTVRLTREPGGAPGAEAIRRLLLGEAPPGGGWSALTEALLHSAARNEHLDKTVRPALRRGEWVISDRFADSTTAYQGGGMRLSAEVIDTLRRLVVADSEPDLTIVLDLALEQAKVRVAARAADGDRYERMDPAFHQRVRAAFLECARLGGDRYAVIDASASLDDVHTAVWTAVQRRFGLPGGGGG